MAAFDLEISVCLHSTELTVEYLFEKALLEAFPSKFSFFLNEKVDDGAHCHSFVDSLLKLTIP